jgi:RNA polymerase sigma factor (sigma-70 family)
MIFSPSEIRTLIHVATKKTGTPVHDEDLEQDVALHALEAFQRLPDVTHPRGLLAKIVRDTVRDYWRRRRATDDMSNVEERFISDAPAFELKLDHQRRLEILRCALDRLPQTKKTLLELFYLRDQSIPEIAAQQGRSISAVKMDLARSRRSLTRIYFAIANKNNRRNP